MKSTQYALGAKVMYEGQTYTKKSDSAEISPDSIVLSWEIWTNDATGKEASPTLSFCLGTSGPAFLNFMV